MALKFYWRCESSTFTGDDYSSGDNTPTDSNITYGTDGAKVGTNGMISAASVAAQSVFTASGILANSGDIDTSVGSCGYWWKAETAFPGSGLTNGFRIYYSAVGNGMYVETRSGNFLRFELANPVPESMTACEIDTALSADTWYFIVVRWDIPNDRVKLEVYTDAGGGTLNLVDSSEVTSGVSAVINSTDLGGSTWTAIQWGVKASSTAYRTFTDNIILSDVYNAPIQGNAFITTDGDYTESTATKYLKVLTHSSAAGASGVGGIVWASSAGIAGSEIGEFTGKTFETELESGKAVLLVPVTDFGGSALTTSDTPVALVRNTTKTTGIVSCTVIEE